MAEDESEIYWNFFISIFFDKLSREMRRDLTKLLTEYGITSSHALYLIALNMNDCQTPASLSRFLDVDAANTNRMLKTLVDRGYVVSDRKNPNSRKF